MPIIFRVPTVLKGYQKQHIRKIFGAEFYDRLINLKADQWSEPIESAYGWHIVFIHDKADPRRLSFVDSRAMVSNDLRNLKRTEAKQASLRQLVSKYRIEVPESAPKFDTIGTW